MAFELVDGYLLGDSISKPDVVATLLRERSPEPAAEPFYRAFEAVGARAADEAFLALRLVLAGRVPDDASVRRLRGLAAVARAARAGDPVRLAAAFARDRQALGNLAASDPNDVALGEAARAAYFDELTQSA